MSSSPNMQSVELSSGNMVDAVAPGGAPSGGTKSKSFRKKRGSSFFQRARMSFMRSKGDRGADVATIRGTRGADFEGVGRIHRGVEQGAWCFCIGGGSGADDKKDRLLLIKGAFCFVYSDEDAPAPKFAVGLQYMRPELKPHGNRFLVSLQDNFGDVQYEMSFETEDVASKFVRVVRRQAETAETEEVRKRLGHAHLLNKRASVRYAQEIAKTKEKDQPEKPITTEEIVSNMPVMAI